MKRFFGKIQFSIRNRGLSPEERAINAAATNAFNVSDADRRGRRGGPDAAGHQPWSAARSVGRVASISTCCSRSSIREKRAERAPLRARFTIDVSDTVPVPIGDAGDLARVLTSRTGSVPPHAVDLTTHATRRRTMQLPGRQSSRPLLSDQPIYVSPAAKPALLPRPTAPMLTLLRRQSRLCSVPSPLLGDRHGL